MLMAVSGSSSPERTWSSLPDDNLNDIYLRLSSPCDRDRFSSVCTSWQAVAWWHPAPHVPVLLPWTEDNSRNRNQKPRARDLESGMALRVPLPWFARRTRIVGSYSGGWIAAMSAVFHHLIIVNISSGAQVKLSKKQRIAPCTCKGRGRYYTSCTGIEKIIFSGYPDSSRCILAAITGTFKLAVCRIGGSPENGWKTHKNRRKPQGCQTDIDKELMDITFCKGKLYGLVRNSWEVFKFHIRVNRDGSLVITTIPIKLIERPSAYKSVVAYHDRYIFELGGKLAIALEANSTLDPSEARFFMVFEIDATPWGYMWTEVTTLGDHALFLGPTNSTAVHVQADGQCGGVEKNNIYYFKKHLTEPTNGVLTRLDLGCFDVYCWENQAMHRWGNQAVHRSGKQSVHHGEVQGLHRWPNQSVRSLSGPVVLHQEVQALRRSLGTMITSQGYHYIDEDGRNGCIWLFLPRDL
ncbi:unnamed protein product [Alopecurus aequalis]